MSAILIKSYTLIALLSLHMNVHICALTPFLPICYIINSPNGKTNKNYQAFTYNMRELPLSFATVAFGRFRNK